MSVPVIEKLVEEFAKNVAAQTDAIWEGDAKRGNKHAKRYISAFKKLREHGDTGRDALATLFSHSRKDVRVAAAAYLLRYRTAETTVLLENKSKGEGLVSFEAQQALERWREGTWALDPG